MASKERRAHRAQQKQQAFQGSQTSEQRISIPAPTGMNSRDNPMSLAPSDAVVIENAIAVDGGLLFAKKPKERVYLTSASGASPIGLITYDGCGSTSAEMWAITNHLKIFNVGEKIDGVVITTASAVSTPAAAGGANRYTHTQFNKTIIAVNSSAPIKWTRGGGWVAWSATASGDDIKTMLGINNFKSRLYAWKNNSSVFWYGSTSQVTGTLNPFDLAAVMSGNLLFMTNMTRDGGSGPDDCLFCSPSCGDVIPGSNGATGNSGRSPGPP